jgi:hypothetical protein
MYLVAGGVSGCVRPAVVKAFGKNSDGPPRLTVSRALDKFASCVFRPW